MSLTQFIMVHTVRILILLQIPHTTTQTQMIMTMYSCWALKEQTCIIFVTVSNHITPMVCNTLVTWIYAGKSSRETEIQTDEDSLIYTTENIFYADILISFLIYCFQSKDELDSKMSYLALYSFMPRLFLPNGLGRSPV